ECQAVLQGRGFRPIFLMNVYRSSVSQSQISQSQKYSGNLESPVAGLRSLRLALNLLLLRSELRMGHIRRRVMVCGCSKFA
ncbi:MAG: hypothetical protein ACO3NK_20475, partial [Prochlorotrichaceae cyanobacterium]